MAQILALDLRAERLEKRFFFRLFLLARQKKWIPPGGRAQALFKWFLFLHCVHSQWDISVILIKGFAFTATCFLLGGKKDAKTACVL